MAKTPSPSYALNTFDVPGTSITATGLNNAGEVVGWFVSNVPSPGWFTAFTYVNGTVTSVLLPNGQPTQFTGINDNGEVTGNQYGGEGISFAGPDQNGNYFNLDPYQFTSNQPPRSEFPAAINESGEIVGADYTNNAQGYPTQVPYAAFTYLNGTFSLIGGPGTTMGATAFVDINDSGTILGDGGVGYHAYTYNNGIVTPINLSAAASPNTITANAINDSGVIVGFYTDAKGREHGFVDNTGKITTVDASGATGANSSSDLVSINDVGVALGQYTDKSGHTLAFIYANGKSAPLTVPNAVNVTPVAINNSGEVTGTFIDATGVTHGFVGLPPPSVADFLAASSSSTSPTVDTDSVAKVGSFTAIDPTSVATMIMPPTT